MSRRTTVRNGLVAVGALALGVWLGATVGLATRARPKS
jgi:hypothetical protein